MNWRQTLQSKTRNPQFLWRMVLGILGAGVVVGGLVQAVAPLAPEQLDEHFWSKPDQWKRLDRLAAEGHWWELWWKLPAAIISAKTHRGAIGLAIFAGLCWLVFLLQSLKLTGWRDVRIGLALVAIALGIVSVWPTLFFIYWQKHAWGLVEGHRLVGGLRFFILGVGLREELAKLICLLPLMPLLVRARSELTVLIVSACVGLGFAIEENISYFTRSSGVDVIGRYLTANPFHLSLTGVIGLTCCRALKDPQGWGSQAVVTFVLAVFAHGLYDAFMVLPALADYGIFSTIFFALIVYQFFRELRSLRPRKGETISLTANFLCGVSLITTASFIYLCTLIGWSPALDVVFQNVLGLAVMVYLFLREMPETMVSV